MWKPTQAGAQAAAFPQPTPAGSPNGPTGSQSASVSAQPTQATMAAYVAAVDRFSKAATAFMQHVELLNQARAAYQQAIASSAELRTILNTGDETLRGFMNQLEQAVNEQASRQVPEKKKPEPAKVEPIKASGDSTFL
jgi:exonuclease VII small subunit